MRRFRQTVKSHGARLSTSPAGGCFASFRNVSCTASRAVSMSPQMDLAKATSGRSNRSSAASSRARSVGGGGASGGGESAKAVTGGAEERDEQQGKAGDGSRRRPSARSTTRHSGVSWDYFPGMPGTMGHTRPSPGKERRKGQRMLASHRRPPRWNCGASSAQGLRRFSSQSTCIFPSAPFQGWAPQFLDTISISPSPSTSAACSSWPPSF